MKTTSYLILVTVAILFSSTKITAQGVHIWKDGIKTTLYSCDVDSLVFFDKNESNSEDANTPISFDVIGNFTGNNEHSTTSFGVSAYQYSSNLLPGYPNIMNNQPVNCNTGGSSYSPTVYWSNQYKDKYAFFAYTPYMQNANFIYKSPGPVYLQYTHPADHYNVTDLRWGQEHGKTTAPINVSKYTSDRVKISFNHALSKVRVFSKLAEGINLDVNTHISLKCIELYNIAKSGELNLYNGTWENLTYEKTLSINNSGIELLPGKEKDVLESKGNCLYFIPDKCSKISILYDIIYTDPENPKNSFIITKWQDINETIEFCSGKQYDLHLNFNLSEVTSEVTLETKVSDW